jgi:predicted acyl esterase
MVRRDSSMEHSALHLSDIFRLSGRNQQEDVVRMIQDRPHFDDYWQDKRAKVERINIPTYVLASY